MYSCSYTVQRFVCISVCIDEDGYFGQQQVPLTDEIKEILEEYPDGQIFKVCSVIIFIDTYHETCV